MYAAASKANANELFMQNGITYSEVIIILIYVIIQVNDWFSTD
jgi:hypothetical protein